MIRIERLEDLNFHHLYYFWVVAQEGSVTAASRRLQLAQPSVSAQLKKLEQALGQKLFERSGRGRRLSEFGERVRHHADRVFGAGQQLLDSLSDGGINDGLPLVVGVCQRVQPTIARRLLRPAWSAHAAAGFRWIRGEFSPLVADLEANRCDVILTTSPAPESTRTPLVSAELEVTGLTFCAAKPAIDYLTGDFPQVLDGAALLTSLTDTSTTSQLRRWFDERGVRPREVKVSDDSAALVEMGSTGLGVFCVPTSVEGEVADRFDVEVLGRAAEIKMVYYAIEPAEKSRMPGVVAMIEGAPAAYIMQYPAQADGRDPDQSESTN